MGYGIRDLDIGEWAALYKRVLEFARTRTGPAHAEEIAQEAFSRVLTTRPWDEGSGIPLFVHMTGIVRSILSNERSSKRADIEHTAADVEVAFTGLPAGAVTLSAEEEHLSRASILQRQHESSAAMRELVRRFSTSPVELAVLGAWLDGITKPSAIAEHTKYETNEVYVALRRIRRTAHSLAPGALPDEELS
ncbi:MAG TPA: hypothetical protein VK841_12830 [Polyangiaceae bacterium]|jgi:DNA-directed RNA polymerase specialized sigma24 family protein|nr:hypothetical protein [Polyangiaceae bacterium]